MLSRIRARLTYANVVATMALFLAMGGGAYAAATIDSADVVNGSLKSVDLSNTDGVRGADVRDDTLVGGGLTGVDIKEATLNEVPSALSAIQARSADQADFLDGKDSSDFAGTGSEPWHEVGTTGQPGFSTDEQCSSDGSVGSCWRNGDFGSNDVGFLRDPFGFVHLKGLPICDAPGGCGTGGTETVFALPAGYRPAAREHHRPATHEPVTAVRIDSEGNVRIGGSAEWFGNFSLDGITFRCAPSGQNGCP
jgi:hypothetical protein